MIVFVCKDDGGCSFRDCGSTLDLSSPFFSITSAGNDDDDEDEDEDEEG